MQGAGVVNNTTIHAQKCDVRTCTQEYYYNRKFVGRWIVICMGLSLLTFHIIHTASQAAGQAAHDIGTQQYYCQECNLTPT